MPNYHICFWFLVPENEVTGLSGVQMLHLLEVHAISAHAPPSPEFSGYVVLSSRYRPPNVKDWMSRYGLEVLGITGGLDGMMPTEDLLAAIAAHRIEEKRHTPRVGHVTEAEAVSLCVDRAMFGFTLRLAEFTRGGTGVTHHLWSLWPSRHPSVTGGIPAVAVVAPAPGESAIVPKPADETMQAVIVRFGQRLEIQWCHDALWESMHLTFVKATGKGILIIKENG